MAAYTYHQKPLQRPPEINFREYTCTVVREAVAAPVQTSFAVQCPPDCGPGEQVAVTNPYNGQRLVIIIPQGVQPGATFQVASQAGPAWSSAQQVEDAQPAQPQAGAPAVGQLVPVDTNGDGINDTFGTLVDLDGDGIPDVVAVDKNNDGIVDQYVTYKMPDGTACDIKVVAEPGAPSRLRVTVPATFALNLKTVVDAVEVFLEGQLVIARSDETEANEFIDDMDFTVQFAKLTDQHQWVNGDYRQQFVPPTMTVVIPSGLKPGQAFAVDPPPGYTSADGQQIHLQVPEGAGPGTEIQVGLPAVEEIPVAVEVASDSQVVPVLETGNKKWMHPPNLGTFDALLAQANNTLVLRGVETIAYEMPAPRCNACIIAIVLIVVFVVIGAALGAIFY